MTILMRDREHEKLGAYREKVFSVRHSNAEDSDEMLKRILGIDSEFLDRIREYICEYPELDDEEIADKIIEDEEM